MNRRYTPAIAGELGLLLLLSLAACHRTDAAASAAPQPEPEPNPSAVMSSEQLTGPTGPPPRWLIDGTTLAANPALPPALDRALREAGRVSDEVQDHIVVDLNGDGVLDAVALLPAPTVAGAYDHLVLLSDGNSVRIHVIADLVGGASFSATVVPMIDGPTLVGVAPRIGGCERGPEWTFLRATGGILEAVGSVRIDDYDCATAEASIEFERDAEGRVAEIVARHGELVTRYGWDAVNGSFAVISPDP
jgi:hypothetical protein